MAKLYAKAQILMPEGHIVLAKTVFNAIPEQARQFDQLGAARPATPDEIKAADAAEAAKNGVI